jgi:HEAT repeat protein
MKLAIRVFSNALFVAALLGLVVAIFLSGCGPSTPSRDLTRIPVAVRPLLEKLLSTDCMGKAGTARQLGQMGEQAAPAIPYLIELLGEEEKLGLTFPSTVAQHFSCREAAIDALIAIGRSATEPLINALASWKPLMREGAIRVLGDLGDLRAVKPLSKAINDSDERVRLSAYRALGKLKSPVVADLIFSKLDALDSGTREEALDALVNQGDMRVRPLLLAQVKSPDSWLRRKAAQSLGKLRHAPDLELLLEMFRNDPEIYVRANCARGLGYLGDPFAIAPLILALKNGETVIREAAASALGELKDPQALEPLTQLLKNENDCRVREATAEALRKITGKPVPVRGCMNA